MKILVLGAGNMGAFFIDTLCFDYEVAVYDSDPERMKYLFRTRRIEKMDEVKEFAPDLLINAVSLQHTMAAFEQVLPYIPETCIISDIASVKNGIPDYYQTLKHRFVSTHPMFGPTFANIKDLSDQSAVIIKESDPFGKAFFRDFYSRLNLNICEYSFAEHDQTIAYSLSIPFASTLVFAGCMKKQEAPGTTFKKHMAIAKGLMSENDYLLSEILMNPYTEPQLERIRQKLTFLIDVIKSRNTVALHEFLAEIRKNIS
ncbi:MAG TPA: prephenate dehydrogenase/arogenate dehydrogenase family protein [Bacteroidales bacterium]